MIDRFRHAIQQRLEQLPAEAARVRRALAALDPREKPRARPPAGSTPPARATPPARPTRPVRRTAVAVPSPKSRPASSGKKGVGSRATSPRGRTAPGATKTAVLAALSKDGAMTAGEVATATGLGRATVSTTLSKLAKSGVVSKAARGYRLPEAGDGDGAA